MGSELILLTGATGLIGFRVLVFCLRQGYRVRVVLRDLVKKPGILDTPSIRVLGTENNLTFVEIPDISSPGAFDDALKDTNYVIHAAAPIASAEPSTIGKDLAVHYLKATTDAALFLLSSAKAHPTVKRVMLTNSLAALIDYITDTDETIHTESTRATNIQQPPFRSPAEAYTAAKIITLKLTEEWVEAQKPAFDLVHMAPAHVFGPNELVTDPKKLLQAGSNRIILAPITGKAYTCEPGVTVHLDDVAEAHVRALDTSIPGNRLYILSSGGLQGTRLEDCFDIVARNFPEHVGNALLNNGTLPTSAFRVDASESARLLGINFIPYDQQVRDTVGYYLDCVQGKSHLIASD
ncbi:NAD dependent epimerase/dehydratase [Penicillium angulare]|uniref:NAD dependent epimerase/dehydratase n=1 Tax=Penicillium angulare TaxID=116970 RepID=UPI00253FF00E|nr:NAD dependent epimerase/dehydratase [Penicillium angulare]KAJ5259399.1 NAD dependent epimerase/dehydratase [Penicillium angulare]